MTTPTSNITAFVMRIIAAVLVVLVALAAFGCGQPLAPGTATPIMDLPAAQRIECGGRMVKTLLSVPPELAQGIRAAIATGRPLTAQEAAVVLLVMEEWRLTRQCLGLSPDSQLKDPMKSVIDIFEEQIKNQGLPSTHANTVASFLDAVRDPPKIKLDDNPWRSIGSDMPERFRLLECRHKTSRADDDSFYCMWLREEEGHCRDYDESLWSISDQSVHTYCWPGPYWRYVPQNEVESVKTDLLARVARYAAGVIEDLESLK